MPLCDCARCDNPVHDAETIGDESFCESCASIIRERDRDYQSVLDTYREKAGEK